MEKTFEVKGMTCVICKGNVEKALKKTDGVLECKVNLLENEATVTFDENRTNEEKLARSVKDAGYELVIGNRNSFDFTRFLMIVSVIGRLISGVHWFTDILGGVLLSYALLQLFSGVLEKLRAK